MSKRKSQISIATDDGEDANVAEAELPVEGKQKHANTALKACNNKLVAIDAIQYAIRETYKTKRNKCLELRHVEAVKWWKGKPRTVEKLLTFCATEKRKGKSLGDVLDWLPVAGSSLDCPTRNHAFEAICKAIMVCEHSRPSWFKKGRILKNEGLSNAWPHDPERMEWDDLKKENINTGSEASGGGISGVDILGDYIEDAPLSARESEHDSCVKYKPQPEGKKLFVQCKYFGKESGSVGRRYGIDEMVKQAVLNEIHHNCEIALFVNSRSDLEACVMRKIDDTGLKIRKDVTANIYGIEDIDEWYQNLIQGYKYCGTGEKKQTELNLRFHQEFVCEATTKLVEDKDKDKKTSSPHISVIWGAVPRSGKTYMAAGMIVKRADEGFDTLIVLGKVGDTLDGWDDAMESSGWIKEVKHQAFRKYKKGVRYAIVIGKELIKLAGADVVGKKRRTKVGEEAYTELKTWGKTKCDVYFDEIHTSFNDKKDEDEEEKTFIELVLGYCKSNDPTKKPLFVGITATWWSLLTDAKYKEVGFGKDRLILWSYQDQQQMKMCSNASSRMEIINTQPSEIVKEVLKELFQKAVDRGPERLKFLEKAASKHPILVTWGVHDDKWTKKEEEQPQSWSDRIVRELDTDYRNRKHYDDGPYKFAYHEGFGRDDSDRKNIQLWFLPSGGKKEDGADIQSYAEFFIRAFNMRGGGGLTDDYEIMSPNIKPPPKPKKGGEKKLPFLSDTERWWEPPKISGQAKWWEKPRREAMDKNKGLIILLADKLRVGVSLPCADIALDFGNYSDAAKHYQTMFRVLTESTGKTKGYYLDMVDRRMIQLTLECSLKIGRATKDGRDSDTEEDAEQRLTNQLQLLNYKGVGPGGVSSQLTALQVDTKSTRSTLAEILKKTVNKHTFSMMNDAIRNSEEIKTIADQLAREYMHLKWETGKDTNSDRKGKKVVLKEGSPASSSASASKVSKKKEAKEEVPIEEIASKTIVNIYERLPGLLALVELDPQDECDGFKVCLERAKVDLENLDADSWKEVVTKKGELACAGFNRIWSDIATDVPTKEVIENILARIVEGKDLSLLKKQYDHIIKVMGKSKSGVSRIYQKWKDHHDKAGSKEKKGSSRTIPKEIQDILTDALPARSFEKKTHGEVMTPPELIDCMLTKLDKYDKGIWSNKDSKFLDPAAGICNFAMVAYVKLMDGLASVIPNPVKRSEHIIQKMLYNVEINPSNVGKAKKLFGRSANIACGDFLEPGYGWVTSGGKTTWRKGESILFDVVMGNPPYNPPGQTKTGNSIWPEFVEAGFSALTPRGYLMFIHPPNWRDGSSTRDKLRTILTDNCDMKYLEMHSADRTFTGANPSYDWYITQKGGRGKATTICDVNGLCHTQDISNGRIVPSLGVEVIDELFPISKADQLGIIEDGGSVIYGTAYHAGKKKDGTPIHDYVHSTKVDGWVGKIIHSTAEMYLKGDGIGKILYTTNLAPPGAAKKKMFGVPKVIFGVANPSGAFYDEKGEYATSQHAMGIEANKAVGNKIVHALHQPTWNVFQEALKLGGGFGMKATTFAAMSKDFYKLFLPGGNIYKLHEAGKLTIKGRNREGSCGYYPKERTCKRPPHHTRRASTSKGGARTIRRRFIMRSPGRKRTLRSSNKRKAHKTR